jgi:outer membrane protein OmpA-like peptidoglycan-associated protein
MKHLKLLLYVALFVLLGSSAKAQDPDMSDGGRQQKKYDKKYATDPLLYDSLFIPQKRMEQHNDFLNRQYPYPSRPRNMWEASINAGFFSVSGDVHIQPGFGVGGSIRKAFGYTFSLRGDFLYGIGKGLNYERSSGLGYNPVYNPTYYGNTTTPDSVKYTPDYVNTLGYVYHNYKTNIMELSLNGIVTLNNIKFHKRRNKVELYGLFGAGGMIYSTYYNALGAGDTQYNYNTIDLLVEDRSDLFSIGGRKDVIKQLKDLMDDTYETPAESHADENSLELGGKKYTFNPVFNTGMGIAFKLGRKVSLAIEEKVSWVNDDLLDGQRWQEWPNATQPVLTREFDSYNYTSVRLNVHLGSKKNVEPLWWLNPLDYGYNELMTRNKVEVKPFELPDSDDDGVPDMFDKEPNTPAGCPVDNHGVLLDTDGDGVPDCSDKELITPTYCQPADKDGVGKCPCCGKEEVAKNCPTINQNVCFDMDKSNIKSDAMPAMDALAAMLKSNPNCKITICGAGGNKYKEQISWSRANKIADYMTEKHGISRSQMCIQYRGECGNPGNTCVVVKNYSEGEPCMNNPPPPHPTLGTGKDK